MPSYDVYYLASTEIGTGIATHSWKEDTSRATPPLHWSCGQDNTIIQSVLLVVLESNNTQQKMLAVVLKTTCADTGGGLLV